MIYDAIIIGGGASGLAAAITLKRRGFSVAVLEKNDRIGKKLLATGNGKCNLMPTQILDGAYNTPFAVEAMGNEPIKRLTAFFSSLGLMLREEDGRIYPYSEEAQSVLNALRTALSRLAVPIVTNAEVTDVSRFHPFTVRTADNVFEANNVVLSVGSEAGFGSDSLYLYKRLGHKVNRKYPSLVPILTETELIKGLRGVRLKARASLYVDGIKIKTVDEELLFKDNGVSGTAAFSLSVELARRKDSGDRYIMLDLVPELSTEELKKEIDDRAKRKLGLEGMFHKEVINNILKLHGAPYYERTESLAKLIKNYPIKVKGLSAFQLAQVASGGLETSEFSSSTLESKIVKGLYATGEALDVDGICGGYNLLFAFATGIKVGESIEL